MVTNLVVIIQSKLEKFTIRGELREAFSDTYGALYALRAIAVRVAYMRTFCFAFCVQICCN